MLLRRDLVELGPRSFGSKLLRREAVPGGPGPVRWPVVGSLRLLLPAKPSESQQVCVLPFLVAFPLQVPTGFHGVPPFALDLPSLNTHLTDSGPA